MKLTLVGLACGAVVGATVTYWHAIEHSVSVASLQSVIWINLFFIVALALRRILHRSERWRVTMIYLLVTLFGSHVAVAGTVLLLKLTG